MVDATIKTVLKRLVPMIEKRVRDEVNLVLHSTQEAATLASKLKRIQEVLEDAERRSIIDCKVKAWLEKIKEAAYEMDDALDEWEAKIGEMELDGTEDATSDNFMEKASSFIQSLCLCFKHVVERRGVALTIKQLNGRLESIDKEIDDEFKFLKNAPTPNEKNRDSHANKRLTTAYFDVNDDSEIKGRDDDKNDIVSKLLSMHSKDDNHLKIISIVGTGGLGKTTLARLVFNNSSVKEYFDETIWVCVSDPFNEINIANSILKSLTKNSQDEKDLQILLRNIETCVKEKRILLVLDDVWEHDKGKWNQLRNCVRKSAFGSRILVTTRNVRVAKSMGTIDDIPLQQLSDQECWSLLSQIAFQGKGNEDPMKQEIGWKIVERCRGLPLAVKTLGSVLQTKHSVKEWEEVLENPIWQWKEVEDDLFQILYLSYNELRPAVKCCFSYCAPFTKDTEIDVDGLIKMWMAQGFLSSGGGDEMELKGWEYFEDLVVRFFFQDLKKDLLGVIDSCKMHDIVHDFAQFLTKNESFIVERLDDVRKLESFFRNARHLNWLYKANSPSPISMFTLEKLQSFCCEESLSFPPHVLGTLKRVGELIMHYCEFEELPLEIGILIHLRYLDLSLNPLKKLLKSLCRLYHLQTLFMYGCLNISNLPEEIHKLRNLRHLLLSDKVYFPQGLEKLTCLRTLYDFKASHGGSKLGCLKNLKQLEILSILIDDLNEESDAIEASKAELRNKNGLQHLWLELRGEVSMDVMEALEQSPYLSFLQLKGFVGFEFLRWFATSLHNLKILYLENYSYLPPLATLQSLEELYIIGMNEMKCLGHEFIGVNIVGGATAFPKLEKLVFSYCEEWTKWEDIGEDKNEKDIMPCLRELHVHFCPNLELLPHRLLRRVPLERLNIYKSDTIIIKQYESNGGFKFLSPTCKVTFDSFY